MPPTSSKHVDVDAAVVFVDMSGFTAFTETHGDHRAAQLAETFAAVATSVLEPADEIIKTIGDAVLVMCENPTTAMASFVDSPLRPVVSPAFRCCAPASRQAPW